MPRPDASLAEPPLAPVNEPPAGEEITLNLAEMADVLGISEPTLRRAMKANADLPILRGGSHGVAYEFDGRAVVAWWREHQQQVARLDEERAAQHHQLRMELLGGVASGIDDPRLNGKQRRDEMEAELLGMKLARERGELVVKAEVEASLRDVFTTLRQELMQVSISASRALSLGRAERLKLEELIAAPLTAAARRLTGAGEQDRAA